MAKHTPEHEQDRTPEHKERKRTRQHSSIHQSNPYELNMSRIPSDVSVEWKRFSNVGQEDPFYLAHMREQGWEPVNPKEHPDWVPLPPDYDKNTITKGGLILMERPRALTDEAREEQQIAAKRQVREAEQRLGLTEKGEAERVKPSIVKEYMRPVTVED